MEITWEQVKNQERKCQSIPAKVYRPIYDVLTYIFVKTDFTANQVSGMMAIVCIFGGLLMFTGNYRAIIFGMIFFIFGDILDYVDGTVARFTNKFSNRGLVLDDIHHWAESTLMIIGVASYYALNYETLKMSVSTAGFILVSAIIISLVYISIDKFREGFLLRAGYSANMKMRKFPFVLFYGGFTEWVKYLFLAGFVFNQMVPVMAAVLIWSLARMVIVPLYLAWKIDEVTEPKQPELSVTTDEVPQGS